MTSRPISRRRALRFLTGAGVAVGARWHLRAQGAAPATLFFYSPENNINNFGTLKGEFDSYFASRGGHRFQPFSDRETFEATLREGRPGLYFLSSWHYLQLAGRDRWRPLLVGALREKNTQRHVLCARKGLGNLAALKGSTIASPGKRDFTQSLLASLLAADSQPVLPTVRVLEVPKDLDALMAVSFGAAVAAIATESGFDRLRNTNLRQYEQLTPPLATGPERMLPIIVSAGPPDEPAAALARTLAAIAADNEGRQRLRLLGLDGWQPIAQAHLDELHR